MQLLGCAKFSDQCDNGKKGDRARHPGRGGRRGVANVRTVETVDSEHSLQRPVFPVKLP